MIAPIVIGAYAFIRAKPDLHVAAVIAAASARPATVGELDTIGDDELIAKYLASKEQFDVDLAAAAEKYFQAGLDERLVDEFTPKLLASAGDELVVYKHSDGVHRRVVLDPVEHASLYAQRAVVKRLRAEIDGRELVVPAETP